ncbi:MAG: beta-galactosidase, partial [Planctomycetota bacterium]
MATMTVDGHTLSLDGRRMWLVSGTVHYCRIPAALWRSRLRAAREAGLNCIETPVVWSRHEPRAGHYDFEGDLDLRTFLLMAAQEGLRCIVRIGPYVGEGYDLGGLPAWLVPSVDWRVRIAGPEYLQACSKFLARVCDQIADLQATEVGDDGLPGPIVMVQNEHEWFCGDDVAATAYLGELARYLREGGIRVPIANRNNLYQSVEGEIDAWCGYADLFAIVRQLRAVRPAHPRIVLGLESGTPDEWGEPTRSHKDGPGLLRAMASTLAAGGQFNLAPFCGGTALGEGDGRLSRTSESFLTTDRSESGPIAQGGGRGELFLAVKRLCTFASSFERLFAGLEPDQHSVVIDPSATFPEITDEPTGTSATKRVSGEANMSVASARGSQGTVAFLFGDATPGSRKHHKTALLLPDGSSLPVDMGDQPVRWVLMDTHLVARSTLDYCSLCAFALVGSTLVLFGAAGSTGMLSISGVPLEVAVPRGKKPTVELHEDITVVVCSDDQIDATYVRDNAVYVGIAGFDESGAPLPAAGFSQHTRIDDAGTVTTGTASSIDVPTTRPALKAWEVATVDDSVSGDNPRYARIDGPASMEQLGAPSAYGWLRLRIKGGSARKAKAALFEAGDRLHVYHDSALLAVVGLGPGATSDMVTTLSLTKGERTFTMLIDNLGRFAEGNGLGERKGLFGHIYEAKALKAGASKLEEGTPIDPLDVHQPVFGVQRGEKTDTHRLTWNFIHRRKSPVLLSIDPCPAAGRLAVIVLNDVPLQIVTPAIGARVVLDSEQLNRGKNTLQIAVLDDMEAAVKDLKAAITIAEGATNLTENAEWSFAKWELPPASRFESVAKTQLTGK